MNSDFTVGQLVFLKIINTSTIAKGILDKTKIDNWIREAVVKIVSNKYITVSILDTDGNPWCEEKFDINKYFSHKYTTGGRDYELFLTKQDVIENIETDRLYSYLKNDCFECYKNNGKYSFKQLKSVVEILTKQDGE